MSQQRFFSQLSHRLQLEEAQEAAAFLFDLLKLAPSTTELFAELESEQEEILRVLSHDSGLVQLLLHYKEGFLSEFSQAYLKDSVFLQNLASILTVSSSTILSGFADERQDQVRNTLKDAIRLSIKECVRQCQKQVRILGELILNLLRERRILECKGRIVLLELPIGNSIPVKLLGHFFNKHEIPTCIVRVSLSRNEKEAHGTTRKQLLERKLDSVAPEDIVLYCDEWISGSNFKAVLKIVRQAKDSGVNCLPIAFQAVDSDRFRSSQSATLLHKKLVKRSGFGEKYSSRFRIAFPQIESEFQRVGYFFWGEHDRLSGYRKMQFLGSLVEICWKIINRLKSDDKLLGKSLVLFLSEVANKGGEIPRDALNHFPTFKDLFLESYEDFKAIRSDLLRIEDESNMGEVCDSDQMEALRQVATKIESFLKGRPAEKCYVLSQIMANSEFDVIAEHTPSIDEHAPVVVELEGDERFLHDVVLSELATMIENWDFSP